MLDAWPQVTSQHVTSPQNALSQMDETWWKGRGMSGHVWVTSTLNFISLRLGGLAWHLRALHRWHQPEVGMACPNAQSQVDETWWAGQDMCRLHPHQALGCGMEERGSAGHDFAWCHNVWRHARMSDPKEMKIGEQVQIGLHYMHTKFHPPRPMHLGMAIRNSSLFVISFAYLSAKLYDTLIPKQKLVLHSFLFLWVSNFAKMIKLLKKWNNSDMRVWRKMKPQIIPMLRPW